jgi:hypothetical protein
VIACSMFPEESVVSNWTPHIMHQLMR